MTPLVLIPVLLVFVLGWILGRHELVERRLVCPRTRTVEEVGVVQRCGQPDHPVGVASCSLLPEGERVDCDLGCLEQLR